MGAIVNALSPCRSTEPYRRSDSGSITPSIFQAGKAKQMRPYYKASFGELQQCGASSRPPGPHTPYPAVGHGVT